MTPTKLTAEEIEQLGRSFLYSMDGCDCDKCKTADSVKGHIAAVEQERDQAREALREKPSPLFAHHLGFILTGYIEQFLQFEPCPAMRLANEIAERVAVNVAVSQVDPETGFVVSAVIGDQGEAEKCAAYWQMRAEQLEAERDRAVEIFQLWYHRWKTDGGVPCLGCGHYNSQRHTPSCIVGKALAS